MLNPRLSYGLSYDAKQLRGAADPVRAFLDVRRVFSVAADGRRAVMREECDQVYEVTLNPKNLRRLAAELLRLADAMEVDR